MLRIATLLTSGLGVLLSTAWAQITITGELFPSVGSTIVHHSAWDQTVSLGQPGANRVWTIGDATWEETGETFAAPAATPHGASFPTASHATTMDGGSMYAYIRVNNDGIHFQGFAGDIDGEDTVLVAEPEANVLPFPLTYGENWTTVWRMTFNTESEPWTTIDSSLYVVDGWGVLQTPFGQWEVLRMQQHHYYMLVIPNMPPAIMIEEYAYHWLRADGYLGASISQADPSEPDPNFVVGNIDITLLQAQSAEAPRGPLAAEFTVGANYPNPFNPSTTLPLELKHAARVTLMVYDETGRSVLTREMDLNPGTHAVQIDGSAWATGTYFARLTVGGLEASTKKMLLIK